MKDPINIIIINILLTLNSAKERKCKFTSRTGNFFLLVQIIIDAFNPPEWVGGQEILNHNDFFVMTGKPGF